ncbi:MAG TPA: ABC transporter substrate-binding protein [Yinghuangia sp.]|uniref:ABC transporter substrate-binding protein n=1 Tax=Yinghuangia sp. YIM S10712 TaxID=3436930 RepID=UPI002BB95CA7|nr:ABC transporter substrate-binding protein [Yinghuangia sp.]
MRPHKPLIAVALAALLAAGCSDRGGSANGEDNTAPTQQNAPVSTDFGDLKGVCGPGSPTTAPAQGVTAKEIKVGVFSDVGMTKNQDFLDAAKVFTSWCNDAGGINGRKLVADIRDTRFMEVLPRMAESCREDFALVGGGAGLDGMGVKDRLTCMLPDFPAQTAQLENEGSDLQASPQPGGASYSHYAGYYNWLLKEAYPGSADAIGIINGDSPVTKVIGAQAVEALTAAGGKVVYNELYPATGIADWTPYAQTIKSKNVKGLVWYGTYPQLAKLEQSLTSLGHKLDWIDTNNNAYGPGFLEVAGKQVLGTQNNLADLSGVHPLENAAANPATKQLVDLFAKYAPGANVTLPTVKAFSAWLLFAESAATCGDNLTRRCAYEAAMKNTAWTGGGLQAPVDVSTPDKPIACFNIVRATTDGWQPADFKPDNGAYRCNAPAYKFTGQYPKPLTLADIGKTFADFK